MSFGDEIRILLVFVYCKNTPQKHQFYKTFNFILSCHKCLTKLKSKRNNTKVKPFEEYKRK